MSPNQRKLLKKKNKEMIKNITAILFSSAIEVDDNGIIIKTSKGFGNFLNKPFSLLEQSLRKQKYQSLKIEDIDEGIYN
jgi:hypothetical protein